MFSQSQVSGSGQTPERVNEVAHMSPLVGAASFAVTYKPVNASTSATNPEFQGNVTGAFSYKFGNKQGDLATATVSFKADSTLTRATS